MNDSQSAMAKFVAYAARLRGDEKSEAQVFCDRLFQAFGHAGYHEAGAELESRQKRKNKSTRFLDLLWPGRVIIEMKKRGEKLQRHYTQAFEYWLQCVPHRPKYVLLCNFDEFWIYDFDQQLHDPVDRIAVQDLEKHYVAFNFLFPKPKKPQFGNDRVDVTRKAAAAVATVFNMLVARGESREVAQRFVLQCVVAMFAEDVPLLPRGLFTELLTECSEGGSTYDIIGGLFRQMNSKTSARAGKYKDVKYFNGGIFSIVEPLELLPNEIALLLSAAGENNWTKVQPPIFGTLFQGSMGKDARHALGAHFTSEADIQKVILPTLVRPWRGKIEQASTLKELRALLDELRQFKVLDPACGSGNFLYVAFRELVRLELELMAKVYETFGKKAKAEIGTRPQISTRQLYGIEKDQFGVELAKVTLMLAKELALEDSRQWIDVTQLEFPFELDAPLPLDNLDGNIVQGDSLFCDWPEVDAIVGNPPFQSKNKAQQLLGAAYMARVRKKYPDVPGRADYCVYWLRRAHDHLPEDARAGLVGTNTIRQNYSRVGGLDYIVNNGGTITEAVSTQVWPGDAVVHVSIVNWKKGKEPGKKTLFTQVGEKKDSPWKKIELTRINSALSDGVDVTQAIPLEVNKTSELCFQGQTQGHEGFLVSPSKAKELIRRDPKAADVLFPYMIGDDLLQYPPAPTRYIIDFSPRDIIAASKFKEVLQHLKDENVLEKREEEAAAERDRNKQVLDENPSAKVNKHHANFLKRWWIMSYPRAELIKKIRQLPRYAACVRLTKRPIFVFINSEINPGDALQVFAAADDYSFGVVQSDVHWQWFVARCSTMKRDFRYTPETVFDTFPWPQSVTLSNAKKVAAAGVELRKLRDASISPGTGYRELYRLMEMPGANPLKDAHAALNEAVRAAYAMGKRDDPLQFFLDLNTELAAAEKKGQQVDGPGLPPCVKDPATLITSDCISL